MEMLGRYELTGQLSGQNSGYSVWGFGKKDGQDYFIKQFLSPKHPEGDTVSSPERLEKKGASYVAALCGKCLSVCPLVYIE